jgi:large-conductance mechanosensitive channel
MEAERQVNDRLMEALSPPGTGRHHVQVIKFLLIYCVFIFLKGRNKERKKQRKKEREEKRKR